MLEMAVSEKRNFKLASTQVRIMYDNYLHNYTLIII